MIVWTVVDPMSSYFQETQDFEGFYSCVSENPHVWLAIESVYFGVLLVQIKIIMGLIFTRFGLFLSFIQRGRFAHLLWNRDGF
jgi:hypothetical protein